VNAFGVSASAATGVALAGAVVYFAVTAAWILVSVHGLVSPNLKLEEWIGLVIIILYVIAVAFAARYINKRGDPKSLIS